MENCELAQRYPRVGSKPGLPPSVRVSADGPPRRIWDKGQQHLPGDEAWLIGEHRASGEREILSRQLGRRNGPPQLSCDDQGTMDLRAGPSTVEGGTRARPLRGKVLARPSSSCADGDDCLRVLQHRRLKKVRREKRITARPLNRRCRRFATPSSTSSCDQVLSDVRTADPASARKSSVSKSAKVVLGFMTYAHNRRKLAPAR